MSELRWRVWMLLIPSTYLLQAYLQSPTNTTGLEPRGSGPLWFETHQTAPTMIDRTPLLGPFRGLGRGVCTCETPTRSRDRSVQSLSQRSSLGYSATCLSEAMRGMTCTQPRG
jgi:hypothetical protein